MTRRGQHTRHEPGSADTTQSPGPEQPSPNADPEQADAPAADSAGVSEPEPVNTESGPPAGWVQTEDGSWAPPADPDPEAEQTTTDYTRCGGHVLTDYGWVPEDPAAAAFETPAADPDGDGG